MQPELQAIQQKYANDRNRLNQETAKVYKKYKRAIDICGISAIIALVPRV